MTYFTSLIMLTSTHIPVNLLVCPRSGGNVYKTGEWSDRERIRLAVIEIVKLYQEGDGDVRDTMVLALVQGSSRRPPIPGAAYAVCPEAQASINVAIRTRSTPKYGFWTKVTCF
jgi:hypothetical protein